MAVIRSNTRKQVHKSLFSTLFVAGQALPDGWGQLLTRILAALQLLSAKCRRFACLTLVRAHSSDEEIKNSVR